MILIGTDYKTQVTREFIMTVYSAGFFNWREFKSHCKKGDRKHVKKLVRSNDHYLTLKDPKDQNTGLMIACKKNNWDLALFLIKKIQEKKYDAHLNETNKDEKNALNIAKNNKAGQRSERRQVIDILKNNNSSIKKESTIEASTFSQLKSLQLNAHHYERWRSSSVSLSNFEMIRKQLNDELTSINMVQKQALLEYLAECLDELYLETDGSHIDEMEFQALLLNHFIKRNALELRNMIRLTPFLIDDQDLKELITIFDNNSIYSKLANLFKQTEKPISLKNCSIFKKYSNWTSPIHIHEKNHFYLELVLNTLNNLQSIQKEIQKKAKPFQSRMEPFQQFSLSEDHGTLCDAAKKLFSDLQIYLSQLDDGLKAKLKVETPFDKIEGQSLRVSSKIIFERLTIQNEVISHLLEWVNRQFKDASPKEWSLWTGHSVITPFMWDK